MGSALELHIFATNTLRMFLKYCALVVTQVVTYFKDLVLETFIKQNTLGLSADKLIEAKEIDVASLREIQRIYESISARVEFKNNVPSVKVDRKDYETWTTSERQNQRL